jgi:hypothetical protein
VGLTADENSGPAEASLDAVIAKVKQMLYTWRHTFAANLNELTPTDLIEHPIDLKDGATPYQMRSFRYPQAQRDHAMKVFPAMEEADIIRRCASEWAANTIFKWESGKAKYRIVHDFRPVNSETKKIQYPCHDIEMDIDALLCGRPRFYGKADASNG